MFRTTDIAAATAFSVLPLPNRIGGGSDRYIGNQHHLWPQSDEEAKQLQGLKALQGLGKSSDKVYGPLQRTFQVTAGSMAMTAADELLHTAEQRMPSL